MYLSLKYEEDPIAGCWNIPVLIFWGCLPLEEVVISCNIQFWFSHLSLSLEFEKDPMSGLPYIPPLKCWVNLLLEAIWRRFDQWQTWNSVCKSEIYGFNKMSTIFLDMNALINKKRSNLACNNFIFVWNSFTKFTFTVCI